MGGGKSRKTGGVSKALINRIKNRGGSSCGSKKGGKKRYTPGEIQEQSRGLLDSVEEE